MDLPLSTYALLFPAVSLLFLAYTNRFLHLSALIRKLHTDWEGNHDEILARQISNLRRRLILIRLMQLLGSLSLLSSVLGMIIKICGFSHFASTLLFTALLLMSGSLIILTREIWISGGALRIVLADMEDQILHDKAS